MSLLYGQARRVLSPSLSSDEALAALGVPAERIGRWVRGVDTSRFDPDLRAAAAYPGEIKVLYAGRLSREKGVELLADSFLAAREQDPRLHLLLAGGGPEEEWLAERLGEAATFLGWLHGTDLPRAYASADIFLFPSATDTYGQVVVEAQASGLPVIAVDAGGPRDLIEDGNSGLLRPAQPVALAEAVVALASSPLLRRRLTVGGLAAARQRSWAAALEQLACRLRRGARPRPSRAGAGAGADRADAVDPRRLIECGSPVSAPGRTLAALARSQARNMAAAIGALTSTVVEIGEPDLGVAAGSEPPVERPDQLPARPEGDAVPPAGAPATVGGARSTPRRSRRRTCTSRTRRCTSTGRSPGWTSTTASCSWSRTTSCRCSSGSSSARSRSRTWTSSSWSASPACTRRSTRGSRGAAPTG